MPEPEKLPTLGAHNHAIAEVYKGHPAGVACDKCGLEMRMRPPGANVTSVPVYCPGANCGLQGFLDLRMGGW